MTTGVDDGVKFRFAGETETTKGKPLSVENKVLGFLRSTVAVVEADELVVLTKEKVASSTEVVGGKVPGPIPKTIVLRPDVFESVKEVV